MLEGGAAHARLVGHGIDGILPEGLVVHPSPDPVQRGEMRALAGGAEMLANPVEQDAQIQAQRVLPKASGGVKFIGDLPDQVGELLYVLERHGLIHGNPELVHQHQILSVEGQVDPVVQIFALICAVLLHRPFPIEDEKGRVHDYLFPVQDHPGRGEDQEQQIVAGASLPADLECVVVAVVVADLYDFHKIILMVCDRCAYQRLYILENAITNMLSQIFNLSF